MGKKIALGGRIKALRKRLGWSQEHFAKRVGISTQYASNIERGKENPTLDSVLRLAESLKVTPSDLFDFETEALGTKTLRVEIRNLLETRDADRLRFALKVLRAIVG